MLGRTRQINGIRKSSKGLNPPRRLFIGLMKVWANNIGNIVISILPVNT